MKMRAAALVLVLAVCAAAWAQPRAYRSINFGDSIQTVASKVFGDKAFSGYSRGVPFSKDNTMQDAVSGVEIGVPSVHATIAGAPYEMTFQFFQGQLFRVGFTSVSWDADYFDTTLRTEQGDLVSVITQAHGPPDVRKDVGLLDMQSGYNVWSDIWKKNADGVSYKIGLGESESKFDAVLWIEYVPLRNKYNQAIQDQQNAAKKKSASDF